MDEIFMCFKTGGLNLNYMLSFNPKLIDIQ